MNNKFIIGIDPDLVKSGIAEKRVGDPDSKMILRNLYLWNLLDALLKERENIKTVYIEAGWLNKKGLAFFGKKFTVAGLCLARDAGINHAIGQTIEMFCKEHEISYKLVQPTGSKWKHSEFVRYTRCEEYRRTNQEQRDAARLIVGL